MQHRENVMLHHIFSWHYLHTYFFSFLKNFQMLRKIFIPLVMYIRYKYFHFMSSFMTTGFSHVISSVLNNPFYFLSYIIHLYDCFSCFFLIPRFLSFFRGSSQPRHLTWVTQIAFLSLLSLLWVFSYAFSINDII